MYAELENAKFQLPVPVVAQQWVPSEAVSYTHLDVYKRQVYTRLSDAEENERRRLGLAESVNTGITGCLLYTSTVVTAGSPLIS